MKRLPLLYFFTLILFGSFTCSKEKPNGDCGPISFHSIDFNGLNCQIFIDSSINGSVDLIINSPEELNDHVQFQENNNQNCQQLVDQLKEIDFNNYVLLLGKREIPGIPGVLIDQKVIKDCDSEQVFYKVSYKPGQYTAMGYFFFGVIIPKTGDKKNIVFNISLIKPT